MSFKNNGKMEAMEKEYQMKESGGEGNENEDSKVSKLLRKKLALAKKKKKEKND